MARQSQIIEFGFVFEFELDFELDFKLKFELESKLHYTIKIQKAKYFVIFESALTNSLPRSRFYCC